MGNVVPLVYHHYPAPRHAPAWFHASQAGADVLAVVGCIALSDRTHLGMGVTQFTRKPSVVGEHVLAWHVAPADVRLHLGLTEIALCDSELPCGVPLVVASDGWCIGLVFGPFVGEDIRPAVRLQVASDGFSIRLQARSHGGEALHAGLDPGPYAWYYLSAQSSPDRLARTQFAERFGGVRIRETISKAGMIHVTVYASDHNIRARFTSRIREAKDWRSNGWSVYD
jgi:hypothetical protein